MCVGACVNQCQRAPCTINLRLTCTHKSCSTARYTNWWLLIELLLLCCALLCRWLANVWWGSLLYTWSSLACNHVRITQRTT